MKYTVIKSLLLVTGIALILVSGPLVAPPLTSAAETGEFEVLDEETFTESGTERVWKLFRSRRIKSLEQVDNYLSSINNSAHSYWRLPTRDELFRLFSKFDLKKNGDVLVPIEGNYWHTDDKGMISVGAWEIGDQCGPERLFYPGKSGYVWAVSSGPDIINN